MPELDSPCQQGEGGDSALLLHPGETLLGVLHPALEPSAQDRPGAAGAGPEEAPAMIQPLEQLCCGDRLRKLGLFSMAKRRLQGHLIPSFQCLKGSGKKDEDRLFSRACCNRTRGNGFKLKQGRFRLDIRKIFFTIRVVKHWNRGPREVEGTP